MTSLPPMGERAQGQYLQFHSGWAKLRTMPSISKVTHWIVNIFRHNSAVQFEPFVLYWVFLETLATGIGEIFTDEFFDFRCHPNALGGN